MSSLHENEIANRVLDAAFALHRDLGPGLLESVYEVLLAHALEEEGLKGAATGHHSHPLQKH
jgi:GxxExxY protein